MKPFKVNLRPPVKADADHLWAWRKQEELNRHQPLVELTYNQLRDDLIRYAYQYDDRFTGERFHWIIERVDGQVPVGWITLSVRNRVHQIGEIGYSLGAEHHGLGYGTEAIRLFLRLAFYDIGLFRVEARCSIHNPASYRLLEKTGFRREGILRQYLTIRGERTDHFLYSIIRPDAQL